MKTDANEYARNRKAAIREGTWAPLVDAEPVREHLRVLMGARVPYKTIADLAEVNVATIEALLYGGRNNSTRRKEKPGRFLTKRVRTETAAKILAIEVPPGEARFRAALEQIMRVTDPGDLRSEEALAAWEDVTPARRIAREALGLPPVPEIPNTEQDHS